jgi:hypothetical protein
MADTNITTDADSNMHARYLIGPFWADENTSVVIYPDGSADIRYSLTTSGGTSWSTTLIETGDCLKGSAWYDKETPGDVGDIVHICFYNWTDENIRYVDYNLSTDTLGTAVTIVSSVGGFGIDGWIDCSITKSVGGNLYVHYVVDGTAAFYRSTDDGANWSARTSCYDVGVSTTAPDQVLLFPADTGDNNDIAALYFDDSAGQMSIKMYDDSANTWTETTFGVGMSTTNTFRDFDGAIRLSDKHLIAAYNTDNNASSNDLKIYDIVLTGITTPVATVKTDVFTDIDATGDARIIINQQNDDIYVAYFSAATTWDTDNELYYKKSDDDATTWGSQTAFSEGTGSYKSIGRTRTITNDGGRIQWAFGQQTPSTDLFTNLVNDIEISAVIASGGRRIFIIS